MEIKAYDVVSIQHYSGANLFRSVVLDSNGKLLVLRLPKDFEALNYSEEDQVILGFHSNNKTNITNCNILSINFSEQTIMLAVEDIEVMSDKRSFERFPVTFNANIKIENSDNKYSAVVKNLSFCGMVISAKSIMEKGNNIDLEILFEEKVIPVSAEVMWKKQKFFNFEYGLKLEFKDFNSKDNIELCLEMLKKEHEDFIQSIKA